MAVAPSRPPRRTGRQWGRRRMQYRTEAVLALGLLGFALVAVYTVSPFHAQHGRFLSSDSEVNSNGIEEDDVCEEDRLKRTSEECCKLDTDQPTICRGFGAETCKTLENSQKGYGIPLTVLGLLYLFIGIAIVCDELFVPALEVIAEQLELSNDVAGATLMAAGGSAPELATSFVGVFQRSDVGFGTIVGSAVFNVLFVIACCALCTPEEFSPLALTWWPLFRDCCYYVFSLATLAWFMSDSVIEIWEAAIQFAVYLGYVFIMKHSSRLEMKVKTYLKNMKKDAQVSESIDTEKGESSTVQEGVEKEGVEKLDANADFRRPSTFRAGILQLLTSKNDLTMTAGVACVTRIKGDVYEVFDNIDKNKNGKIEPDELQDLMKMMNVEDITEERLATLAKEIDTAGNGVITKREFVIWYTKSEERILKETKEIFDKFDSNNSGTIDKQEIENLLTALGNKPTSEDIQSAMDTINLTEGELNFDDFNKWYKDSLFWTKQTQEADEAAESCESLWQGILSGCEELKDAETPLRARVNFIITLPLCLFFCIIPDCRPPGCEKWAVAGFFMSILVIGLLATLMVELATIFGDSLGIPTVVMGLTVLAAGTSVPDLLSSVIVAKQGEGDMAVSSSIGSNIFDVAVGLPVPWLVFGLVAAARSCNCNVVVGSDGLLLSLLILVAMLFAIVITIFWCDWKMTKTLGWVMFFMYFIFVVQALLREKGWEVADCGDAKFEFSLFA